MARTWPSFPGWCVAPCGSFLGWGRPPAEEEAEGKALRGLCAPPPVFWNADFKKKPCPKVNGSLLKRDTYGPTGARRRPHKPRSITSHRRETTLPWAMTRNIRVRGHREGEQTRWERVFRRNAVGRMRAAWTGRVGEVGKRERRSLYISLNIIEPE